MDFHPPSHVHVIILSAILTRRCVTTASATRMGSRPFPPLSAKREDTVNTVLGMSATSPDKRTSALGQWSFWVGKRVPVGTQGDRDNETGMKRGIQEGFDIFAKESRPLLPTYGTGYRAYSGAFWCTIIDFVCHMRIRDPQAV